MITAWRAAWPLGDFPFLYVQLASYSSPDNARNTDWAQLREAQEVALHLPAVGQAIAFDNVNPGDIHPVNKRPIGERLAAIALNQIHDQRTLEWSGPVFQSLSHEGAALRVRFSSAEGLKSTTPEITGFEIAGADKVFHVATAMIEGTSVLVRSPEVAAPVAVRYAYRNIPAVSLFNAAGRPAGPFRSDDW
jgi:sialate O-acetylesterase